MSIFLPPMWSRISPQYQKIPFPPALGTLPSPIWISLLILPAKNGKSLVHRILWIYEKAKNVEQYPYHFPICLIPFHIWDRDSGFGNEGKPSYRYRYIRLSSQRT